MSDYYARYEFTRNQGAYDRKQFSTYEVDFDCTIHGGVDGVWILGPSKISYTITVEDYDEGLYADHVKHPNKPYIMFKCTADASFFGDIVIQDESSNTLYTFTGNYIATPGYCVLTLDTAAAGYHTWKAA